MNFAKLYTWVVGAAFLIAVGATLAIRSYVNIKDSPTSTRVEDATVPQFMFTLGYSVQF